MNTQWMALEGGFSGDAENAAGGGQVYFALPDGEVWSFRMETLTDRRPYYLQMEASPITELYHYSDELHNNNLRLAEQHARMRRLLDNIVETNREKEILHAKMRIHEGVGRCILTTKKFIQSRAPGGNTAFISDMWRDTILNLYGSSTCCGCSRRGKNTRKSPKIWIFPKVRLNSISAAC